MKSHLYIAILLALLTTACATSTPALHVIGVHEGQYDQVTFMEKCADRKAGVSATEMAPVPKPVRMLSPECTAIRQNREVVVNISDNSQPIVLALTAYNKTHWKVLLENGVRLQKVILAGYHSQQVSGIPSDVPIEAYTYDPSPCKQCWQGTQHFYSHETPAPQLTQITGLKVTSFQGRYTGSEFSIFPKMRKYE